MTEETKPATTKKATTRKAAARKTIVMQKDEAHFDVGGNPTRHFWADMTGADFGDDPETVANQRVQVFKDSAKAIGRLRTALMAGKIDGGTFRIASCSEPITPKVEQKQTNLVTM